MLRRTNILTLVIAGLLTSAVMTSCERIPFIADAQPTAQLPAATAVEPVTVVEGLNHPWGVAWLPNGDVLITERSGQLRRVKHGQLQEAAIAGVPAVLASGQGGLLDVAVHPEFEQKPWVYFSYSAGDQSSNRTQVARAQFDGQALSDWQVIFRVSRDKTGTQHFGSRLAWLPDGTLLVSIGDGGNPPVSLDGDVIRKQAQNLSNALGSVVRIQDDGSLPPDNPFVRAEPSANPDGSQSNAIPELWSYGHRNIQGLAVDPQTAEVWATEHGARGGDELNRLNPGENYGWPEVSYSKEYTAPRFVAPLKTRADVPDPWVEWTPSIAPSGLAVYRGDRYPGWQGNLFAGALVNREVRRLVVQDGQATEVEAIALGQRVRDIKQGPDGWLYVLTDDANGRLVRLEPVP